MFLLDGAIALDCYSDAYEDAVDEVTQKTSKILQGIDAKYDMPKLYEAQDAIAEAETKRFLMVNKNLQMQRN